MKWILRLFRKRNINIPYWDHDDPMAPDEPPKGWDNFNEYVKKLRGQ